MFFLPIKSSLYSPRTVASRDALPSKNYTKKLSDDLF